MPVPSPSSSSVFPSVCSSRSSSLCRRPLSFRSSRRVSPVVAVVVLCLTPHRRFRRRPFSARPSVVRPSLTLMTRHMTRYSGRKHTNQRKATRSYMTRSRTKWNTQKLKELKGKRHDFNLRTPTKLTERSRIRLHASRILQTVSNKHS